MAVFPPISETQYVFTTKKKASRASSSKRWPDGWGWWYSEDINGFIRGPLGSAWCPDHCWELSSISPWRIAAIPSLLTWMRDVSILRDYHNIVNIVIPKTGSFCRNFYRHSSLRVRVLHTRTFSQFRNVVSKPSQVPKLEQPAGTLFFVQDLDRPRAYSSLR